MVFKNKNISLITLGCPKNQVDSEVMAGVLSGNGFNLASQPEEADVILINTCGFIKSAKQESIDRILEILELKKNGKDRKVYVWGCLSERYKNEIAQQLPEVDGFFGIEPFEQIARVLLGSAFRWDGAFHYRPVLSTPSHAAYLKIADGCDHECTFCAIPLIKGPFRSRPVTSLIREASLLAERGVKELILIAQDTTRYGYDLGGSSNLNALLKQLTCIEGIDWIRIMYTHPNHISDDFIQLIASEEKICSYIDMPLQHISNPMLKAMGRGSTNTAVRFLIEKLRDNISNLVLRTSFIVGFPGETEAMFQELIDFIKDVRFERLGAFVYSPEEETPAESLESRIPENIAEKRYQALMETQNSISAVLNQSLESGILPVLVDGYDKQQGLYHGRTEGDCLEIDQTVWIQGETAIGEIIPVRIEATSAYDLYGKIQLF